MTLVVLGRCEAEVPEPPHYLHEHRCFYQARHQRTAVDGQPINVCGLHHRKRRVVRFTKEDR